MKSLTFTRPYLFILYEHQAHSSVSRRAAPLGSHSADSAKDLFILHEGTRVKILDNVSGFSNIELADGRQGWISARDIEVI